MQFLLHLYKVLPLLKAFIEKTFAIYRKSAKNVKFFSHSTHVINFIVLDANQIIDTLNLHGL